MHFSPPMPESVFLIGSVSKQFINAELARLPAIVNTMPEARGRLSTLDAFLHEVRTEM